MQKLCGHIKDVSSIVGILQGTHMLPHLRHHMWLIWTPTQDEQAFSLNPQLKLTSAAAA